MTVGGGDAGVVMITGYENPGGSTLGVSVDIETTVSACMLCSSESATCVIVSSSVSEVEIVSSAFSAPCLATRFSNHEGDGCFATILSPRKVVAPRSFIRRRRRKYKTSPKTRRNMIVPRTAPMITGVLDEGLAEVPAEVDGPTLPFVVVVVLIDLDCIRTIGRDYLDEALVAFHQRHEYK